MTKNVVDIPPEQILIDITGKYGDEHPEIKHLWIILSKKVIALQKVF